MSKKDHRTIMTREDLKLLKKDTKEKEQNIWNNDKKFREGYLKTVINLLKDEEE